jgi:uncharacterized Zn finger protein (UPF0148 family)
LASVGEVTERRKVATTADLMRRGATLLNEACPRCGGVQIRYQGKVYCINEDDISGILSSSPSSPSSLKQRQEQHAPIVQPLSPSRPAPVVTSPKAPESGSEKEALKALLEEKLAKVSKQLDSTQDFDQQAKLLDLISKYLETLEKLKGNR